jgi:hypothetical protein
MDLSTVIYENTVVSLPADSWKIIIEYLNEKDCGSGFGSIFSYRAINKMFFDMIFECIREVKININYSMNLRESTGLYQGSNNYLLKKRQKINNIICGCKGLRSLHISVIFSGIYRTSSHTLDYNELLEGLQQIGNDCEHIEELCIKSNVMENENITKKLPSFPNLRKLSLRNFRILPSHNTQKLMNLLVETCLSTNGFSLSQHYLI